MIFVKQLSGHKRICIGQPILTQAPHTRFAFAKITIFRLKTLQRQKNHYLCFSEWDFSLDKTRAKETENPLQHIKLLTDMKKILILIAAVSLASCSLFQRTVFEEDFNAIEEYHSNWDSKKYKAPGNIIYAESAGIEESGCIKITSRRPTHLSTKCLIGGLEPGKLYRVSVMAKSKNIKGNSGAAIFVGKNAEATLWNSSEPMKGSVQEWQEVFVDFMADESGQAMICCGLGTPWDATSFGTVWFDNLKVKRAPFKADYNPESEHTLAIVEEEEPIEE
jgi:hypothetical protein